MHSDADQLSVTAYRKQFRHFKQLSASEKRRLASDRDAMVTAHVRYAFSIAKGYQKRGVPLADLFAEAILGLFEAHDHFDPSKGVAFTTYSSFWVRRAITSALKKKGLIHIPNQKQNEGLKFEYLSVDKDERNGKKLLDLPAEGPSSEEAVDKKKRARTIQRALSILSDRDRRIMRMRFWEGRTLMEIGDRIGLSRERIRQIIDTSLHLLKHDPLIHQARQRTL